MSLLTSSSLPPFALIDSSFFYKYIDRSEKRHQEAVDLLHQLVNAGTQLVTTNFLVAESHSLVLARTKRIDRGIEFLDLVQGSDYLTSLRVTPQDEARAHQIVRQYTDKRFSLVDA